MSDTNTRWKNATMNLRVVERREDVASEADRELARLLRQYGLECAAWLVDGAHHDAAAAIVSDLKAHVRVTSYPSHYLHEAVSSIINGWSTGEHPTRVLEAVPFWLVEGCTRCTVGIMQGLVRGDSGRDRCPDCLELEGDA